MKDNINMMDKAELIRIYGILSPKNRARLMMTAHQLERLEGTKSRRLVVMGGKIGGRK